MNHDKTARDNGWAPGPDGKWANKDKPGKKYDNAKAVCDGEGFAPKPE